MEIKNISNRHKYGTNKIIGDFIEFENSKITFLGENNVIVCDGKVKLENSNILFRGNNSIVFLGSSKYKYRVTITMNDDNVLYLGKNCFYNTNVNFVLAEHNHIFVGNECMFSLGVWLRTSDAHPIYDSNSKKRINDGKSIYLGDHVWVGQDSLILKGSRIDSGSIIGAKGVVSKKLIPHNQIWGGIPCKFIKKDIFWDATNVYRWDSEDLERTGDFTNVIDNPDKYVYKYSEKYVISFDEMEEKFNNMVMLEKIDYLNDLYKNKNKNRFVHTVAKKKRKRSLKRFIKKVIKKVFFIKKK